MRFQYKRHRVINSTENFYKYKKAEGKLFSKSVKKKSFLEFFLLSVLKSINDFNHNDCLNSKTLWIFVSLRPFCK